jgi:hypothetical protein
MGTARVARMQRALLACKSSGLRRAHGTRPLSPRRGGHAVKGCAVCSKLATVGFARQVQGSVADRACSVQRVLLADDANSPPNHTPAARRPCPLNLFLPLARLSSITTPPHNTSRSTWFGLLLGDPFHAFRPALRVVPLILSTQSPLFTLSSSIPFLAFTVTIQHFTIAHDTLWRLT